MDQRFCPRDGSTLRAPPGSDLVGSILADRYHVIRRIGEGGLGQVYLAEHVKMKRKSAVKVLHQGMVHDHDAISRFNREASNASQIQHPNVAAIYDFGETPEGLIYLAMEFVDGEPLTKIIERTGALTAARAADIGEQVASALEAAHDMGIIHRDLKPDNIMIARGRAGEDVAKVVDFGIAKAMEADDQKVTKTGLAIGTPEYMSPEQLGGDQLDSRTDIYSLGLVTFNMLTGQLPFPSVVSREALIMRLTEKPRTLAETRNDVKWPAELQTVMDRALANHPADRYQHVSQFGRELVTAVATMPESAFTSTGTVELAPFPPAAKTEVRPLGGGAAGRRDRANEELPLPDLERESSGSPVGLIFGVLLVLLLGGGGAWWYWNSHQLPATSASAAAPAGTTTPPVASVADSAVKDSATLAASHDSTAPAAATPAAATPAAASPATDSPATKAVASDAPKSNLSSDQIDDMLAPIREDLSVGRERMNEGEYDGAVVRFGNAQDKIAPLAKKYADVEQIRSLKREIGQALSQNRAACKAERDLAIAHGGTPAPDCP
ncbi:MAG TPA: serine/threonine-protein kinase [Gemmatimonadaceae bacterium]|nr:serine/threonine-protein kinase [Gemmatimonadaceae bacterium]